jgi:OOP family OmpA-OmpF porin
VSNALTAQGKELCSAVSKGETDLAVQTGDGVREPLNRRAVVSGC